MSTTVVRSMLALRDDASELRDVFYLRQRNVGWRRTDLGRFVELAARITGEECVACEDCDEPTWLTNTTYVDEKIVCEGCLDSYFMCPDCDSWADYENGSTVGDDRHICENCLRNNWSWCDECDEYYPDDYGHSHEDECDCDCEAPHPRFTFPANGAGEIANDTRLSVTLPAGVIDETGLRAVTEFLRDALAESQGAIAWSSEWYELHDQVSRVVTDVGPVWQTKQGNWTRRLSKAFHLAGVKLPDHVLSKVGNIARDHSSATHAYSVEFTRDLNQSAEDFYHADSCWWAGYSYSRCSLKSWGGIGLRSFNYLGYVTGRAWVLPLNEHLMPTHATHAHAYLVFNGYGEFEGYNVARIVAHLSSKSYRKVNYTTSAMYVNNGTAYLVADEATCAATDGVRVDGEYHDCYDAAEFNHHHAGV